MPGYLPVEQIAEPMRIIRKGITDLDRTVWFTCRMLRFNRDMGLPEHGSVVSAAIIRVRISSKSSGGRGTINCTGPVGFVAPGPERTWLRAQRLLMSKAFSCLAV